MAKQITIKYPLGTVVKTRHREGIEGIVVAALIKSTGCEYQCSHIDKDGAHVETWFSEVVLKAAGKEGSFGFGKE